MILDGLLLFTGNARGATGTIANGAYTDAPTTGTQDCSNIIDLGELSGLPPSASGGGARDIGIGDDPAMKVMVAVTTAMVGGSSLQMQIQGAPDNGTGGLGSWTVMWTGPAVALAALIQGAQIANVDMPKVIPGQPVPRFLKMTCVSGGTFTGGAIEATLVLDRFDQILGATTGALSGYVPGITVPN